MKKFTLYALTLSSFCMMSHSLLAGITYLPKFGDLTFDDRTHQWTAHTTGQYAVELVNESFGVTKDDIPFKLSYVNIGRSLSMDFGTKNRLYPKKHPQTLTFRWPTKTFPNADCTLGQEKGGYILKCPD